MSDFLPEGYQPPTAKDKYMKFEQDDNRFRILTKPILGIEGWIRNEDGKKPVRVQLGESLPGMAVDTKEFWAMAVWNYKAKKIQILQITQSSIKRTITGLSNDEEWGSPLEYDIVVNRTGEGLDTEYVTTPKPKKELTKDVLEAYEMVEINLEALYENGDPLTRLEEAKVGQKEIDEMVDENMKNDGVNLEDIPF